MSKLLNRIAAILICICIVIPLGGCKKGNEIIASLTGDQSKKQPEIIDEAAFTIPYLRTDSLNPYKATSAVNKNVAKLLYDSLFDVNQKFEIINRIADSQSVSDGVLTVTIKSGLKFSDGSPLTSKDIIYSFELAKDCIDYTSLLENITGAEASGDNSVKFTLTVSNPNEAVNLVFPIIKSGSDADDTDITDNNENDDDEDDASDSKAEKISSKLPIGSGRYTLATGNNEKHLNVNTARLGGYHPIYGKIALSDVTDSSSLQSLFDLKRIDFYCNDFSDGQYARFSKISSKINMTNFVFLGINSNSTALSNSKIRRAMALALDRTEIASVAFADCAVATSLPIHPDYSKLSGYSLPTLSCKTGSAVSLLEDEGYSQTNESGARYSDDTVLSLTLLVNTENAFRLSAARSIQQSLEKINIKVTIREVGYDDYASSIESGSFDLYIGETKLSNSFSLDRFFSDNGGLKSGISAKSRSAAVYKNYACGKVSLQKFIDAFSDDLPFIPLAFRQGIVVGSDKIATEISTYPDDCFANINEWTVNNG